MSIVCVDIAKNCSYFNVLKRTMYGLMHILLIFRTVHSISCFFLTECDYGSAGNKFVLGFQQGHTASNEQLQLLISTSESSTINFEIDTGDGEFTYVGTVTNTMVHSVNIPWQYQVEYTETGITNQGIRVKAEPGKKLLVQGVTTRHGTGDAYSAFPCSGISDVDEYEYYAISYHATSCCREGSTVVLVGCEDNTIITIDDSMVLTLNQMQTYLHHEPSTRADLTGAHYVANKPISVIAGHPCTNIPNGVCCCDVLIEQIPPTATWGSSFLSKSFEGRDSGEVYRILAAHSLTVVTVSCSTGVGSFDLNTAGSWAEFQTPANSYCSIETNNSVLVMQYMLGAVADSDYSGDPLMMMVPPVSQYSNHHILKTISTFSQNFITLFVAPEFFQPQSILVDGSNLDEELWIEVLCSDGSVCGNIASVEVPGGDYQVVHQGVNGKIGVSVHGMSIAHSYGYIGGIQKLAGK